MSSAEVLASVDIVALRLNPGHGLELLLIRRAQAPFAGQWALPGVLVNGRSADHSLDDAAVRALRDKARLEPAYIEQVATVGNAVRVARAELLLEQSPSLKDLLRLLRDADTRRGLVLVLGSLRSLGRQLAAEQEVAHGA